MVEPEMTRPLRVEKISANGVEETIVANERERAALARRFDLIDIKSLTAKLNVRPERTGMNFAVTGKVEADVVQRCVVTLEPLDAHVEQAVDVHYAAPEYLARAMPERDMDEEDMEPIDNGIMDLGELAAQHLGLGLEPYPRKADLPPLEAEFGEPIVKENPFAKLVLLKGKKDE